MRRLLLSVFVIFLLPVSAHGLSDYEYSKKITISTSVNIPSGYTAPIKVCPYADPVEVGSWSINGKTYNNRISIPVVETTGASLSNYWTWVEINTEVLVSRELLTSGMHGYEVEFNDGSNNLTYWVSTSNYNNSRTRYFVQRSYTARESFTLYYYFDADVTTQSSNYSADGITPSKTVPDMRYCPLVRVPFLVNADVYLDDDCSSFPNDVAFATSSGTQLYQKEYPETLITNVMQTVKIGVKLPEAITAGNTYDIYIWYGNGSQTTRHAYWSGTNTFKFYDDFESGVSSWSSVSGTWAQSTQLQPIQKGGRFGLSRGPYVVKDGSTYRLFSADANRWEDFGYALDDNFRLPWDEMGMQYGSSLTDFKKYIPKVFENRASWSIPAATTTTINGVTKESNFTWQSVSQIFDYNGYHYALEQNWCSENQTISLWKSTDYVNWTPSTANPILTETHTWGSSTNLGVHTGKIGACWLLWDSANSRWVLYSVPANSSDPGVVYVYTRSNASPEGEFTYQGIARSSGQGYVETVNVFLVGGTYYMFSCDLGSVGGNLDQQIRYATASNPLGPFTDQGRITHPLFNINAGMSGMPTFFQDGSDWYTVYFTQSAYAYPCTLSDDNFICLSKCTTWPNVWAAQNTVKTINNTSSGITLISGSTYSNVSVNASLLLKKSSTESGVVVRYQDASNYYRIVFSRSDGKLKLHKVVSGSETELANVSLPWTLTEAGTFYPIDVSMYDNRIVVKVSQYGEYWYTLIDQEDASLYPTGYVGLYNAASGLDVDTIAIGEYVYPEPTYGIDTENTITPSITGGFSASGGFSRSN